MLVLFFLQSWKRCWNGFLYIHIVQFARILCYKLRLAKLDFRSEPFEMSSALGTVCDNFNFRNISVIQEVNITCWDFDITLNHKLMNNDEDTYATQGWTSTGS